MLKDMFKKNMSLTVLDDTHGLYNYVSQQALVISDIDRLQKVIDGGYIHSTSLPNLCLRQVGLHRYTKTKILPVQHSVNDSLVRYIGRATETYNRDMLVKKVGKNSIIGKWVCHCKTNKKELIHNYDGSVIGEDKPCNNCGHDLDIYEELPIKLEKYHAVCNPDLCFFNSYGEIVNWELKSIKDHSSNGQLNSFKELVTATDSNKQQALMQKLFLEKAGFVTSDYSIVNYTSKAHTGYKLSPFKEFKIYKRDNIAIHNYNINILNKGVILKTMDDSGLILKNNTKCFPDKYENKDVCKTCLMSSLCKQIGD